MPSTTKLTESKLQALEQALLLGMPRQEALALAGVAKSTFHYWLQEAAALQEAELAGTMEYSKANRLLLSFADRMATAQAKFIQLQLARVQQAAANGSTRDAKWLLEKVAHRYFGRLSGPVEEVPDKPVVDPWTAAAVMVNAMEGTMRGIDAPPGMLPQAWTTFRPTLTQIKLLACSKRFIGLPCGRGSGKTEIGLRRLVRCLAIRKDWPNPIYFYAAPTTAQAFRVAWDRLRALIPPEWLPEEHIADQYIEARLFGSRIYVLGMDKPARIEGNQWDGGILDESSDQKPRAFSLSVLPALSHRAGWAWRAGVPKRQGIGAPEYRQWCEEAAKGDDADRAAFSWGSDEVLDADALRFAKATLDARDYGEQFGAIWQTSGGGVFHAFDERLNVRPVKYDPEAPLVVGCDFNVDHMAWTFGHRHANRLEWFAEIYLSNANTQLALDATWHAFHAHKGRVEWYCDAAGKQRNTASQYVDGAIVTNLITIMNDKRFKALPGGRVLMFPTKTDSGKLCGNPPIQARFASCNAMFCNAAGERRMFIDPGCKKLIECVRSRHYKPGGHEVDDPPELGHWSDAMGYAVWRLFPLRYECEPSSSEVIITQGYRTPTGQRS